MIFEKLPFHEISWFQFTGWPLKQVLQTTKDTRTSMLLFQLRFRTQMFVRTCTVCHLYWNYIFASFQTQVRVLCSKFSLNHLRFSLTRETRSKWLNSSFFWNWCNVNPDKITKWDQLWFKGFVSIIFNPFSRGFAISAFLKVIHAPKTPLRWTWLFNKNFWENFQPGHLIHQDA